ncbi:excisionase family DNA-binding protein [Virgibacillus kimchii]
MYVTIPKIAEYLSIEESKIGALVLAGRIRAIHDGEQFLVNKDQFSTYFQLIKE